MNGKKFENVDKTLVDVEENVCSLGLMEHGAVGNSTSTSLPGRIHRTTD